MCRLFVMVKICIILFLDASKYFNQYFMQYYIFKIKINQTVANDQSVDVVQNVETTGVNMDVIFGIKLARS